MLMLESWRNSSETYCPTIFESDRDNSLDQAAESNAWETDIDETRLLVVTAVLAAGNVLLALVVEEVVDRDEVDNWDADFIALSEDADLSKNSVKVQSEETSSAALSVLGNVDIVAAVKLHVGSAGLVSLDHGDRVANWEDDFLATSSGVWEGRNAESESDDSEESGELHFEE